MSSEKKTLNELFWDGVEKTAKVVDSWPEWKQRGSGLSSTAESVEESSKPPDGDDPGAKAD